MDLTAYIRDVPDFPKPGILFKDITPMLQEPAAFREAVDLLADLLDGRQVDALMLVEARGFIFGAALAYRLGIPLVPLRKEDRLPAATHRVTYSLEYGDDVMEMHKDGVAPGSRVVVVDDVLATGGTLAAACRLVEEAGAEVEALAVVIELTELSGRDLLKGYDILTILEY